ncbi:MAG: AAA family ATPase [Bryobacteraceae bacterium]
MIKRELTPLLARSIPQLFCSEIPLPRSSQEVAAALRAESPDLCFVDFAKDSEGQLSLVLELLKLSPRLVIIALLSASDPSLVLRCLRQGASDFLLSPFSTEHVDATIQKVSRFLPADKILKKPASVYCVVPAKGACGATTIASNLAYQWKRHGSKRILLADLDPLAGTLSFVLKIKSQYSFMDVLHRSSDIDADLWNAMVTKHHGVDVLLSPESTIEGADDLTDASSIIEYARYNYDLVVLDADGVYGPWNLTQATLSDEVLLITTNELSSLQAVQRALAYLENNGVGRWKVRVIVNRYQRDVGLSEEVIGTALNTDIYHFLPSDYEGVQKALMEGKSIPPSSNLGKSLAKLADRMAGREESARKSTSFAGLLSLFTRTSS